MASAASNPTNMTLQREVKYLNRDFNSIKRDLMKFSQAHHSGAFQDFNESSPGMSILELVSYVGDVLSFYQDMQFEELRQASARQLSNVVTFAKLRGYRPVGPAAAVGKEAVYVEVPAISINGAAVPDDRYSPILSSGAQFGGPNNTAFETLDVINFSASLADDPRFVTGSQFDPSTGVPTKFAIKKMADVVGAQTTTDIFSLTDFKQFLSVKLSKQNVTDIVSVIDSDGNPWHEVDYLAQGTIFNTLSNESDDSVEVPYILQLMAVPRRFITDRDPISGMTSLVFGTGDGVNFDDQILPNIADLAIPLAGRQTFSSFSIDPQNFLNTSGLGLAPYNTTLTVKYRSGGGTETNVPAGSIKTVKNVVMSFSTSNIDPSVMAAVQGSVECTNPLGTEGGSPAETISAIKANAAAFFAAQDRVVTKEDYIVRVKSIPAKFGKPEKVYVSRNAVNPLAIDIHVLALDENGYLTQATPSLIKNIKTYLQMYRIMTDAVNILQTNIIDLRVNFGVVVSSKLNRTTVLADCLSTLSDYFATSKMDIGSPIILSDAQSALQAVYGVISVYKLEIRNISGAQADGTQYSSFYFDVQSRTSNGILYCPADSIFEVKYPAADIIGEAK